MKKLLLISLFLLSMNLSAHPIKRIIILIHGTWALKESWHMPDGDFFEALTQNESSDTAIITFLWSGGLGHQNRLHGAKALRLLIQSYPPEIECIIVGHSHGVNVAIIASQLLANDPKNIHSIDMLYALGVPISPNEYAPNMNIIKRLYNLFSFDDMIQPLFGIALREFQPHERITNLCVTIDGRLPNHSMLHNPVIATGLLKLPELIPQELFSLPGLVHFSKNIHPVYELDTKREILLEHDKEVTRHLAAAFHLHDIDVQLDQEFHLQTDTHHLLQKI